MHFRILKMIATSGFLTALEYTKFDFGGALPRTPLGELAFSRPFSWFKGPTSKGRGEKEARKEGMRERKGGGKEVGDGTGNEENGREGVGMPGKGEGREWKRRKKSKNTVNSCLRP